MVRPIQSTPDTAIMAWNAHINALNPIPWSVLHTLLITNVEVAQQSKARKKDDFLLAFSPVIAEATATAYKGATSDVQNKLRRVVEVWRQRNIFEAPIQDAIEARINELDKTKDNTKRGFGGGGLFSKGASATPAELQPLVAPLQTINKLAPTTETQIATANADYDKQIDPNVPIPSAPVHAARLNGLLKTLANAEGAVAESIKARTLLISGLEKLLESNRAALAKDQEEHTRLSTHKAEIDTKKRDVEDAIMKGFGNTSSNPSTPREGQQGVQAKKEESAEAERPQVEALTPPPFERLSQPPEEQKGQSELQQQPMEPPQQPQEEQEQSFPQQFQNQNHIPPTAIEPIQQQSAISGISDASDQANGFLASLNQNQLHGANGSSDGSATKKRKTSHLGAFGQQEEFPDFGGELDGIDEDVQEMLRGDGGGSA